MSGPRNMKDETGFNSSWSSRGQAHHPSQYDSFNADADSYRLNSSYSQHNAYHPHGQATFPYSPNAGHQPWTNGGGDVASYGHGRYNDYRSGGSYSYNNAFGSQNYDGYNSFFSNNSSGGGQAGWGGKQQQHRQSDPANRISPPYLNHDDDKSYSSYSREPYSDSSPAADKVESAMSNMSISQSRNRNSGGYSRSAQSGGGDARGKEGPKKMSWASIASQPAKSSSRTSSLKLKMANSASLSNKPHLPPPAPINVPISVEPISGSAWESSKTSSSASSAISKSSPPMTATRPAAEPAAATRDSSTNQHIQQNSSTLTIANNADHSTQQTSYKQRHDSSGASPSSTWNSGSGSSQQQASRNNGRVVNRSGPNAHYPPPSQRPPDDGRPQFSRDTEPDWRGHNNSHHSSSGPANGNRYSNQHTNHSRDSRHSYASQQSQQQQHQRFKPPPPPPAPSKEPERRTPEAPNVDPVQLLSKLQAENTYNPQDFDCSPVNARFFIIKSYSEDDIHRSIKYSIWCSTEHGNKRLDQAYKSQEARGAPVYLFYSVNGSGHFCGMAQMVSALDYNSSANVWAQDKWKGQFKVRWIYVKDVPNSQLRHIKLENNENKPVTNSRDTQEVPLDKGKQVLKIISTYRHSTSIFDDFLHYEKRQEEESQKRTDHSRQESQPAAARRPHHWKD